MTNENPRWVRRTSLTVGRSPSAKGASAAKLQAKIGRTLEVIIDAVEDEGATGRSQADAPEIDGEVHLRDAGHLKQGDIVKVAIEDADEHDLFGVPLD